MKIYDKVAGVPKYDHLCDYVMQQSHARISAVIIIDGNKGHGFSIQSRDQDSIMAFPDILRSVADDMEKSLKENENKFF